MFCWFQRVERTDKLLENPFGVYDLTFLEWEHKKLVSQQQKVYFCANKPNERKPKENPKFELIFKKQRLSFFSFYRHNDREKVEEIFNCVKTKLNSVSDGITSRKPRVIAMIVKDIVNSIVSHPNWTCAHIAAKTGLEQMFILKKEDIMADLNTQSPPDMSTPLHLTIESGKVETTKAILDLKPEIDVKDRNGNTAVHLAAMSKKAILCLILKETNVFEILKQTNTKGCTPLHLSCFGQKYGNVFQLLRFGLTVQMMSVSAPEKTVKGNKSNDKRIYFTKEEIEDFDTTDMKFGGTPLHWVTHRRALEKLIDYGFGLNKTNVRGETAIHTMVRRMRLKCLIGLLCFGAKVNKVNKLGDSPLHRAVIKADVTSCQALIIFDADINARNLRDESPRHIAAQLKEADHHMVLYLFSAIGAKRCDPNMNGCKSGCAHNGLYEGKPYHRWPNNANEMFYKPVLLEPVIRPAINRSNCYPKPEEPKGVRMLCLDGGGIRGLITTQMLIELEQRLNGIPISSCFQWFAGTSTGSILAVLIATRRKLTEIRGIYFRFKDKIMVGPRPYSTKNFEALLEEEIGSDLKMCDVKDRFNHHLLINSTLTDRNPTKLHVFRSHESSEEILGLSETAPGFKVYPNYKEQLVWKACRASSAAPTYFRASGAFIDGGLIANNPTLDALTEFKLYNNSLKSVGRYEESKELDLVLSLGTGKFSITPTEPIDVERIWSLNPKEILKNTSYIAQMGNLLINQVCATEGYVIDRSVIDRNEYNYRILNGSKLVCRAQSWCSGTKIPYFRVNPVLSEVISLAETSDIEICNALWETKAFMYAMKEEMEKIVELILPTDLKQPKPLELSQTEKLSTGIITGYTINVSKNDVKIDNRKH